MTREEAVAILESEVEYLYSQDEPYNREAFRMAIEALKAEPIKHGRWKVLASGKDAICTNRGNYWIPNDAICTNCGKYWIPNGDQYDYKYCPHCGARMDGGEDGNTD